MTLATRLSLFLWYPATSYSPGRFHPRCFDPGNSHSRGPCPLLAIPDLRLPASASGGGRLRPQGARGWKPKQVQCTHLPEDGPRETVSRGQRNKPSHTAELISLESGNVLLSRPVSRQVPSALKGLTSVFGMGTGGSLSPLSPEFCQGLVQSVVLLASAVSISNHSLRLGNPPHIRASFFYCAYPENRTSRLFFILQRPASNFPFGLISIL